MLLAMALGSVLCIAIGAFPHLTVYPLLPFPVEYVPYDATHVITQLQLLVFSSLGVFWMMRLGWYPPEKRSLNLDADWTYRWLVPRVVRTVGRGVAFVDQGIRKAVVGWTLAFLGALGRSVGPSEGLSRHYPTGSMVLWVSVLLAAFLLFYFL
jgi:multicomponent Na+:H+ antiporter subunit D